MVHLFIPWLLLALSIVLGILLVYSAFALVTTRKNTHSLGARVSLISAAILTVMTLSINISEEVFSVGSVLNGRFRKNDGERTIKVLSYNVHGGTDSNAMASIKDLIRREQPDYLFLTECGWPESAFADLEEYPHLVWSSGEGWLASRVVKVRCSDIAVTHSCITVFPDLVVVSCHLASNNYFSDMDGQPKYMTPDSLSGISAVRNYIENYDLMSHTREEHAHILCDSIACAASGTPAGLMHPTIVIGDMNDVCGSAALRVFEEAGLRDAWWDGGFGYGATFHHPLPFRIDHILYSPDHLRLRSIRKISSSSIGSPASPASDHDCLIATFSFR